MIVRAWRIYKPRHAATAFTGEGARLFGGRFNSKGVAVVYTSSSVSLASLELLVHLQSAGILARYVLRSVEFDDSLLKKLNVRRLPKNWRSDPPPAALRRIGDDWIRSQASVVLEVPSVIVPKESNYLLNPRHPDFAKVKVGRQQPWRFDARLWKR